MPTPLKDQPRAEGANLGKRLDGWKDIAAYLGKVERTVKRWDADRGLPTHRVPGGGRASVYAYTRELDEWLKSGKALEVDAAAEVALEEDKDATPAGLSVSSVNDAQDSTAASLSAPQAPAHRTGLGLNWKLALAGMLVAGMAGAGTYAAVVRPAGNWILRGIPALLSGSRPKANRSGSKAVSDSEKSRAHDLYLKGRFEWGQRTPDSLNRALDDFTQAIVHNPGYAEAYAGLADTYDLLREYSTMPDSEAYTRAIAAARKAVELDDSLAEAHRALAFAEYYGNWDFVGAETEFRRAIELNPNDPLAHKWYANAIFLQGRFPESLAEIEMAQELDPSSVSLIADKGEMLFSAGRRQEGIELMKEVERTAPEFSSPHFYLMNFALGLRDYRTYLAEGEKTAESMNDAVLRDIVASARAGYARNGERGLLDSLYARQEQYHAEGRVSAIALADTCEKLGKKQEALQLFEEAYADHEAPAILANPVSLKDDPRYKALRAKLHFPPAPQQIAPKRASAPDDAPLRAVPDPH